MSRIPRTLVGWMVCCCCFLSVAAYSQSLDELVSLGERQVRSGRLAAAEKTFLSILETDPENTLAIEALAQITAFQEKWGESILYHAAYGYLLQHEEFVQEDVRERIEAHSKRIPRRGFLVAAVQPADAVIYINNVPVGQGRVSLPIAPLLQYSVTARREDYHPTTPEVFTTEEGESREVTINLREIIYTGRIQFNLKPQNDVTVYVDGSKVGVSPSTIEVPVGRRLICFKKEGFDRWWRAVTIRRDENFQLDVTLRNTDRPDEPCNYIPDDF